MPKLSKSKTSTPPTVLTPAPVLPAHPQPSPLPPTRYLLSISEPAGCTNARTCGVTLILLKDAETLDTAVTMADAWMGAHVRDFRPGKLAYVSAQVLEVLNTATFEMQNWTNTYVEWLRGRPEQKTDADELAEYTRLKAKFERK